MHGNLGKRHEPPLSPATRRYLDDFTRFVLEGKSTGDPEAQQQAARDKAASFAALIEESSVTPSERGQKVAGFAYGSPDRRAA